MRSYSENAFGLRISRPDLLRRTGIRLDNWVRELHALVSSIPVRAARLKCDFVTNVVAVGFKSNAIADTLRP